MIDKLTWQLVAAILATSCIVGAMLDVGFGRLYNPSVRIWMLRASRYLEHIPALELIAQKAHASVGHLTRMFGSKWISWRFILIATAIVSIALAIDIVHSMFFRWYQEEDLFWTAFFIIHVEHALIQIVLNAITAQLSLLITLILLRCVRPSVVRLAVLFLADILAVYALGPIPVSFGMLGMGWWAAISLGLVDWSDFFIALAMWPFGVALVVPIGGAEHVIFWIVFVSVAAIPTIVHLSVIGVALTRKIFFDPSLFYLAGVLEFLSRQERPFLKIFAALGLIPAIIRLWIEI